jgi:hypothetical protein
MHTYDIKKIDFFYSFLYTDYLKNPIVKPKKSGSLLRKLKVTFDDNVSVVIEGSSDTKKMIDIEGNYLVHVYLCIHLYIFMDVYLDISSKGYFYVYMYQYV